MLLLSYNSGHLRARNMPLQMLCTCSWHAIAWLYTSCTCKGLDNSTASGGSSLR